MKKTYTALLLTFVTVFSPISAYAATTETTAKTTISHPIRRSIAARKLHPKSRNRRTDSAPRLIRTRHQSLLHSGNANRHHRRKKHMGSRRSHYGRLRRYGLCLHGYRSGCHDHLRQRYGDHGLRPLETADGLLSRHDRRRHRCGGTPAYNHPARHGADQHGLRTAGRDTAR